MRTLSLFSQFLMSPLSSFSHLFTCGWIGCMLFSPPTPLPYFAEVALPLCFQCIPCLPLPSPIRIFSFGIWMHGRTSVPFSGFCGQLTQLADRARGQLILLHIYCKLPLRRMLFMLSLATHTVMRFTMVKSFSPRQNERSS